MLVELKIWSDLKAFSNALTEDQLAQSIRVWGEGFTHTISGADILDEDMINPSGDGAEPVSVYLSDPDYGEDFVDDEPRVAFEGEILLNAE